MNMKVVSFERHTMQSDVVLNSHPTQYTFTISKRGRLAYLIQDLPKKHQVTKHKVLFTSASHEEFPTPFTLLGQLPW